ncbi:MAG: hypothetical protein KGK08_13150 [Acidobacteriota bacterium]|nr:hypothetical protein [Acidobacteriota bacterium]
MAAAAQQTQTALVMPPVPLLPMQFGGWQLQGAAVTGTDAAQGDTARASALHEFGLTRYATGTYKSAKSATTLEVKAYEFVDATGATAAFTYFRTPQQRDLAAGQKLGSNAAVSGDAAVFTSGASLVVATSQGGHPQLATELKPLEVALPKIGGSRGAAPLLPGLVPAQGLEAGSVRYALGPVSYQAEGGVLPPEILGWDKSAEVVTAHVSGGGVLTLLLYPTPQIAGDRGRAIEAAINAQRARYGVVKLRREGPMLVLGTGSFSPTLERQLVESVHLPVQLTWDKKMPLEFHAEVRKTYSLLTSIAVFCGVGALAAILLGLFLGFGRAWVRVLMGKPAATEPEFLRIDLRGGAAPLHAEGTGPEPQS